MTAVFIVLIAAVLILVIAAWKGGGTLHECLFPELYGSDTFPEARYPTQDEKGFRERTALGYGRMRESAIVICGITRDDAETLPLTIRRIEKTGRLFADYRVVLFENDSLDQTPVLLQEWVQANSKVTILSESLRGRPELEGRFARLAHCRNRYLDHIEGSPDLAGFSYLMVVDMDMSGGWSLDGIASTFAETGWDAVASNSFGYHWLRRTYYDTWALKPQTLLKQGWFNRLIGEGWQFRRGDSLIPVESAFGGLALYRREALAGRRYSGTSERQEVCEHHSLNADQGLRFFLNPSQITVIGTQVDRTGPGQPARCRELARIFRNW